MIRYIILLSIIVFLVRCNDANLSGLQCRDQLNNTKVANSEDCREYLLCIDGEVNYKRCPEKKVYDDNVKDCVPEKCSSCYCPEVEKLREETTKTHAEDTAAKELLSDPVKNASEALPEKATEAPAKKEVEEKSEQIVKPSAGEATEVAAEEEEVGGLVENGVETANKVDGIERSVDESKGKEGTKEEETVETKEEETVETKEEETVETKEEEEEKGSSKEPREKEVEEPIEEEKEEPTKELEKPAEVPKKEEEQAETPAEETNEEEKAELPEKGLAEEPNDKPAAVKESSNESAAPSVEESKKQDIKELKEESTTEITTTTTIPTTPTTPKTATTTTTESPSILLPPPGVSCRLIKKPHGGFIPDPNHCNIFWVCVWGWPVKMRCPANLWFDRNENFCNYPDNVTDCPAPVAEKKPK